jgi:hypothetical protein
MTRLLARRPAATAALIFTAAVGALLIVVAVATTTIGPIAVWFLGLFVVVLLWLASRR